MGLTRPDPARRSRPYFATLAYAWTSVNSLLGLCLLPLALASSGEARLVEGVLEIHGRGLAWLLARIPHAEALTLGHVVLARDRACLRRHRHHEWVHVRQYELWGPAFLPAYLLSSLLAYLRGEDPYRGNRFEREAFAEDSSGRS